MGASGGGATDIRVDLNLNSRIMVAGGGGGVGFKYNGGNAGGLEGEEGLGYNSSVI